MSTHLLSVSTTTLDGRAQTLRAQAQTLGLDLAEARVADLYWLDGLSPEDATRLMTEAVLDPVTEALEAIGYLDFRDTDTRRTTWHTLDIGLLPGVTDPRSETLREAARLLGFSSELRVATGRRYHLKTDHQTALSLAKRLLANPVIERFSLDAPLSPAFVEATSNPPAPESIDLNLDDAGLLELSASRRLAEMRAIAAYFKELGRPATDLELEMFAQTWSEHCVHKTFRAHITTTETDREGAVTTYEVDGLLKSYLRRATDTIAAPWVRSAFIDNAGIVALTDSHDVAIKVETHNHPSALEPFGGANTGVGGVVRDVIGVSARPIANLDVLCFAPPDTAEVPPNILHPRRIRDGVVHGVEDYGNKMGIPTVAGQILYHPGYLRNPLVFCGTVGVLPTGSHP
ncbi:MAG TPA: phosphoribosylformylglycinamidine synthase subunit PurS, partial [Myxococcota bacterium]|nr:phosphoribosylformylglycinamidine synthase subunit PurS [Myxococcota bacterium]